MLLLLALAAIIGLSGHLVLVARVTTRLDPITARGQDAAAASALAPSLASTTPPSSPPAAATSDEPRDDRLAACTHAALIGKGACSPRRIVFVGGLQRSGTSTLAELLGVLPGVSPLHFDARSARHMEAAPWKSLVDVHTGRRMKWAYFREVVSTGGAEGKLLQSVFPYRYAVWDAKFGRLPALLAHPSRLSPLLTNATREQLWDEWRQFWSTRPARVLLDKSPENVLMAPFLEALLGRRRVGFVFVMRHPLSWALVAAKWGCVWQSMVAADPSHDGGEGGDGGDGGDGGGGDGSVDGGGDGDGYGDGADGSSPRPKSAPLGCLEHLIDVWLAVHEQAVAQLPFLTAAALVPAESDAWLASPSWLGRVGGGELPYALPAADRTRWGRMQAAFREGSHAYVHCFLRGYAPRRARVRNGRDCAEGGGVRETSSASRLAWLRRLKVSVGARVRALGYSMHLGPTVGRHCCNSSWDLWRAPAEEEMFTSFAEARPPVETALHEALVSTDGGGEGGGGGGGGAGGGGGGDDDDGGDGGDDGEDEAWLLPRAPSYEAHADGGEGLGLHAGASALVVSSNFLSGFNGMQQRAAQLSAALGKLGYAIHYVAAGPLNSTAACASATPAVICHGEGDTDAQYGAYAAWAKATRATPTLAAVAFTSLTLEVSRALLRLPRAAFGKSTACPTDCMPN